MNFKLTINDVKISNTNILDRVEFVTDMGVSDFTVGKFITPTAKIKLHEDVDIKVGDVVKIYLDDVKYFIGEPYEIKQQNLYRDITLYSMPYFLLTKTYQPTKTEYTTRSLLLEMQVNVGFNIVNFQDIPAIDMKGVQADTSINLLQSIAMILGRNVSINPHGEIEFLDVASGTVYEISQSQITSIAKSDTTDYNITRIIGKRSDSDNEEENPPIIVGTQANAWNDLTLINPYLTESILTSILSTLPNYTGFDLTIFDSPSFKPLDRVKFTYKNVEYTIPVMNLTLTFSVGGLVAKVQSCVSNAQDKSSNYKGSMTTRLEVIRNVQSELNTKVEVVDGRVSSLITRTDVIESDMTTIHDQYSQIQQDLGNIELTVGDIVREEMTENLEGVVGDSLDTLVDTKLDGALGEIEHSISTNTEKISSLEITTDSINATVKSQSQTIETYKKNADDKANELQVQITTNKNNISSLNVDIDEINATISEELEIINTELDTVEKRVSSAEQKITDEAIVNTVSKSNTFTKKTDFDNMKIGGENLILNSDFRYGWDNWHQATGYTLNSTGTLVYQQTDLTEDKHYQVYTSPIDVSKYTGQTLTLTFVYNIADKANQTNSTIAYVRFFDASHEDSNAQADSIAHTNIYYPSDYVNSTRRTSETQITVPTNAKFVRVGAYQQRNGFVNWRNFQLEVGNKATAWKPSIKDVENDVNDLQSQVESHTEAIASLQINADNISMSVKEIQTNTEEALNAMNNDVATLSNQVQMAMTSTDVKFLIQEEMENGIDSITTETGYTFDKNGLTISKTNSELSTVVDEDGMTIKKNNSEVMLDVSNEGVVSKNIDVSTYLIVGGNSRLENYGSNRTGCFWIGDE